MFASKAVMFGNVFEIQPIDMACFYIMWSSLDTQLTNNGGLIPSYTDYYGRDIA
jgi:hypothetical protein